MEVGLSAVIKYKSGERNYWALVHPVRRRISIGVKVLSCNYNNGQRFGELILNRQTAEIAMPLF